MPAMGARKLIISRGNSAESRPAPAPVPAPPTPEYHLVHDRLTALERLDRLHRKGALSAAEFAAEKEAILSLPAEELPLLAPAAARRPHAPSLAGRLLDWRLLSVGIVAGLALGLATLPQDPLGVIDRTARLLG